MLFRSDHVVTWDEFRTVFREKYIPKTVMDGMRKKFQSLTQGKMDMEAYSREFTRLARAEITPCSETSRDIAHFRRRPLAMA